MTPASIEDYLSQAPPASLPRLERLRAIAREEVPGGEEVIAYGIPTIRMNGMTVHFAGFKGHIGFYPGAEVMAEFEARLQAFKRAKGSVQFPHDKPLPEELIRAMIRARLRDAG